MEHFQTSTGPVWAVQLVIPFVLGGRRYESGSWIVGDRRVAAGRVAMTNEQFKDRRAALEIFLRRRAG